MALRVLITILLVTLVLSPTILGYDHKEVKAWCSKMPNPEPCEYFLSHSPKNAPIRRDSDFLQVSVELALERALHAQAHAYSLGPKCRNNLDKAAWEDCLKLHEFTIAGLNRTLSSKRTEFDAQTWLSTALTNLETCQTGFIELGVSDYLLPSMANNVSKLISNTLAVNKGAAAFETTYTGKWGFPTWFTTGHRKLLQAISPAPSPASSSSASSSLASSPASSPAFSPLSSLASSMASQANIVVAQDGSGNYKTIEEAVAAAASGRSGSGRFVIHVKAGTYNENVDIPRGLINIVMVGDGIGRTIITGSRSVGGGATTFNSATFGVDGDGFIASDITFRNTAGPQNHQAVAVRCSADLSVFYRCSFEGYQDTLYVHSQRQFYRECDIYGTVDFIFGNAAAVFQNCNLYARNPPARTITFTAQGRTDPNQNTGISIHNSRVTAAPDLLPVQSSVNAYLGRPWQKYSRTVYLENYLDSLINPAGWMPWSGNFALNTLYYGEYMNTGPGSSTAKRVTWKGYHVITSVSEASQFTVANFIAGNTWLPATTVPFTPGL